jgi:predicted ribosomally synthesized peptide with SipW-like signal peptide
MKNKKLVLSLLLVLLAVGGAMAGTFAFFTAQRSTTANRFAAGTLDLNVASNNVVNEPFVIENLGATGDISGTKTWTVRNTGTLPGRFLLRLQNVNNQENGCNDQEEAAEPACDADTMGELGNVINLKVQLDGVDVVDSLLTNAQQSELGQDWNALTPVVLQANEERTITTYWDVDEDAYGNEIQSDSVDFNMNFRLIQLINGPTPSN